jgi:hypothetical protein
MEKNQAGEDIKKKDAEQMLPWRKLQTFSDDFPINFVRLKNPAIRREEEGRRKKEEGRRKKKKKAKKSTSSLSR